MNCKECVHFDVCNHYAEIHGASLEKNDCLFECKFFKQEYRFVELNAFTFALPARGGGKTLFLLAYKKIYAEAIKLFAGRLKARRRKMLSSDWLGEFWDYAVLVEDIDKIAKEMGVEL